MRIKTPSFGRAWRLIAALLLAGAGPLFSQTTRSELAAKLTSDVAVLAGEIGPRSLSRGDSLARAAEFVERRFREAGWDVRRQVYTVNGTDCANLEVERRGTSKPDEIVIVGAHYDTVPQTPGADDNASGVAALLALAQRFSTGERERTLRFVAFANEEPIYFQTAWMGSRVYARACKERGNKVVAMLSLETMGYFSDAPKTQKYPFPLSLFYPSTGNFLAVVGNRESGKLVKRVTKTFRATGVLPVESAALPGGLQGVGWSDHWSFWQEGYPAVMISDTALFRNPHYHRSTDTPETLDYARLAAAVEGLSAVVEELTGGPASARAEARR